MSMAQTRVVLVFLSPSVAQDAARTEASMQSKGSPECDRKAAPAAAFSATDGLEHDEECDRKAASAAALSATDGLEHDQAGDRKVASAAALSPEECEQEEILLLWDVCLDEVSWSTEDECQGCGWG